MANTVPDLTEEQQEELRRIVADWARDNLVTSAEQIPEPTRSVLEAFDALPPVQAQLRASTAPGVDATAGLRADEPVQLDNDPGQRRS